VEVALPTPVRDALTGTSYAPDEAVPLGAWDVKVFQEES